ncbi:hypothetical protein TWF730_005673 [Orbilia blumenaviensis]|uniref:25S rRNA adenine-N(1) methyltransferase n=1 Tax=Orbilia blumenaviensis TaxID=1796055 RepID=A0AAV9VJG5_9PEZI
MTSSTKSKSKSKKKRKQSSSSLLSRRHRQSISTTAKNSTSSSIPTPTSASTSSTNPLPSKLSRALIRSHHTTQKRLSQAIQQNDTNAISELTSELTSSGGLEAYQRASVSGQSSKRGGDSSKILVDWFAELGVPKPKAKHTSTSKGSSGNGNGNDDTLSRYRLLEIGCLSPTNAIHTYFPSSRRTLMDLNSLHPDEILKQDFMKFPVPKNADNGYDIISCSLVLNYVPTPAGRGEMLEHITSFMEQALERRQRRRSAAAAKDSKNKEKEDNWTSNFPSLFLVLPAPCVTNSRYLTEDRLQEIMVSMGYELVKRKLSPKLVYYLWKYIGGSSGVRNTKFRKTELLPGGKRNNFAIVVE